MSEFDVEILDVDRHVSGRQILSGIQLAIKPGEFFSLLGPSGCGKTTLLRMIAGFDEPDRGELRLGGQSMRGVPAHRRDVHMVFQSYALFPHLSVGENVAFGLKLKNPRCDKIPSRVAEALSMVRLSGYERRDPKTLSGGEQQRVALARAIVNRPRVLVLDEPLGALDLRLRKGLQEELRRLQRQLGMTFVYVTHDQEEALSMSDRIAVMNLGRIEQIGSPKDLYHRPKNRFVAEFVGTANIFEGAVSGSTFRSSGGLGLPMPAGGLSADKALMIRPEKLSVMEALEPKDPAAIAATPPEAAHGRTEAPAAIAVIEEILYHGSTTRLILKAQSHTLIADDRSATAWQIGQRVGLRWGAGDFHEIEVAKN